MLQKIKFFQFSKKSRRFIFFIYWDWNWTYLQWWHRDGGKPEKLSIWDHVSHDFTSKLISMTNKFVLWMKNKNKEFLGLSKCNSKKWRKNNCKYWKWPLTNCSGTMVFQKFSFHLCLFISVLHWNWNKVFDWSMKCVPRGNILMSQNIIHIKNWIFQEANISNAFSISGT